IWADVYAQGFEHYFLGSIRSAVETLKIVSAHAPESALERTIVEQAILPNIGKLSEVSRRIADEVLNDLKSIGYEAITQSGELMLLKLKEVPHRPLAAEAGQGTPQTLGKGPTGPN
ncbi:MAG: hypothetical protein PHY92_06815, partial [Alphaproteobacteria bacterium]|nr:hypothetical protein [Alphaproteobacteria bacterium]